MYLPSEKGFTTLRPSSPTRRRWVRLSPIAQDSLLLPPVGVGAVLSPPLAGHPLRPATRHRLGGPLPHQQPDRTRAPLPATEAFHLHPMGCRSYAGLSSVSRGYTPPEGRLLTRYSAVCRFIIVAEATITLDLHALSAPPAFTLSQDQTLLMRTLLPFTIQLLKCPLPPEARCRQRRLRSVTVLHRSHIVNTARPSI